MLKRSEYNIVHQQNGRSYITNFLYNTCVDLSSLPDDCKDSLLGSKKKIVENSKDEWAYKLGFLVDETINEEDIVNKKYFELSQNPEELEITFIVTEECNFNCKYCYQNHIKGTVLSYDKIDAVIRYVHKNAKKLKRLKIHWFGGEPLLEYEKIIYTMKKLEVINKENNISMIGHITTNGYDLTLDKFSELLKHKVIYFQITIDGNEATHNFFRPHKSNEDSYQRVMKNLYDISASIKKYYLITIRINMVKDFLVNFDNNIENFKSLNSNKKICFNLQKVADYGGDRINNINKYIINDEEYDYLVKKMVRENFKINKDMYSQIGSGLCTASKKNAFYVNYDGNIVKCSLAIFDSKFNKNNIIGKIDENGDLIFNENFNLWNNRKFYDDTCVKCKSFPLCMANNCPYKMLKYNKKKCYKGLNIALKQSIQNLTEVK